MASSRQSLKRAEMEARLEYVEELLTRQLRTRSIVKAASEKFAVSARMIYMDIERVRAQWVKDSVHVDREVKRREVIATLKEAIAQAFQRREVVKKSDGSTVFRDDGKPVTVPDPDLRAVIRASSVLADVQGLKTFRLETQVQQELEQLLDAVQSHMSSEAYEDLVRALGVAMGVSEMADGQAGGATPPLQH